MNVSEYNIKFHTCDGQLMLFNTITREVVSAEDDLNCSSIEVGIKHRNQIEQIEECIKQNSTQQMLTIIPTTNCNARCWYCFEKGMSRYDMSSNIIDGTINFIKSSFNDSNIKLNWSGGEPLMNIEAIIRITDALNDAGYKLHTSVTTNGSILPPDFLSYIKQANADISFGITIDEINEAYNITKRIFITNNIDPFQNLIKNIHCILESEIRVSIRINFSNIDRAKIIYSFLEKEFAGYNQNLIYIYFAYIWNSSEKDNIALNNAIECIKHIKNGYNISVFSNPYISNVLLRYFSKDKEIKYCSGMNRNNFIINADGNLYRCHRLIGNKKYSCGDVIEGIDKESLGFTLFEPSLEKFCTNCKMSPICTINCKTNRIIYGKNTICKNTKIIVEHLIKEMLEHS